ncbi:MAG: hypothetical protein KC729_15445, partial [Candidatus Eisenbacteria bacterium]|nr:hypothetical protein [Candidatus Eisenbacteria bacterium]
DPPPACVVALDPENGEVLALASQPGFDPNVFVGGLSPEEYKSLLAPDKPQHNRAISSTYPPGSTFKAVTSLAALQSGVIARSTRLDPCYGSYQFGNRRFGCWKRAGHGSLDEDGALRQSCDVYYYQVGLRLGMEQLSDYAHRFGLADRTGIDIPGERTDLIPDAVWYREHRDGWGKGVVLNLAIGQGELLISPIALARFYAGMGARGQLYQPHLLLEIQAPDGTILRDTRQDDWRAGRLPVSAENLQIVREGLESVVMHAEGTGKKAKVGEVRIAGKTGTAENPSGKDHALFACYAPADAPRIVVVVIAEESGHGGSVAAPVAQKVMEEFFLGGESASLGWELADDPNRADLLSAPVPRVSVFGTETDIAADGRATASGGESGVADGSPGTGWTGSAITAGVTP